MDQSKIVGKQVAVAKANYLSDDKKYTFGNTFELMVTPLDLESMGTSEEALEALVKEVEALGPFSELAKAAGDPASSGYHPGGLVVVSKADPRLCVSIELGGRWMQDSDMLAAESTKHDATFKFFVDNQNVKKEMGVGAVAERGVDPLELDLISKLREATKEKSEGVMGKFQPVMEAITNKGALTNDPFLAALMEEGERMSKAENRVIGESFDRLDEEVDFFGLPTSIMEELESAADAEAEKEKNKSVSVAKDMKEVSPEHEKTPEEYAKEVEKLADDSMKAPKEMKAGDVVAEPVSEVGKETGEKKLDDKALKVGEPGDDHGDHVEGKGNSDDQQSDLAAAKVKVGKVGDDHGKVMSEGNRIRGRLVEGRVKKKVAKKTEAKNKKKKGSFLSESVLLVEKKIQLWKKAENYGGEDLSDWYVGPSRTRDSDALAESNFEAALERLGGEQDDKVQVGHFGHWAVGWVETILVHKDAKDKVAILQKIADDLENYPVLDEDDFYEREQEELESILKNNSGQFVKELAKVLGRDANELNPEDEKVLEEIARAVLQWSAGYFGNQDAWVDVQSMKKHMRDHDWEDIAHNIKSPLVAQLQAAISGKASKTEAKEPEVVVYDNGGKTADRYTVVIKDGGEKDFYHMSDNQGFQGVNMYAGNVEDGMEEGPHLGEKLSTIPRSIKGAVMARLKECMSESRMIIGQNGKSYKRRTVAESKALKESVGVDDAKPVHAESAKKPVPKSMPTEHRKKMKEWMEKRKK